MSRHFAGEPSFWRRTRPLRASVKRRSPRAGGVSDARATRRPQAAWTLRPRPLYSRAAIALEGPVAEYPVKQQIELLGAETLALQFILTNVLNELRAADPVLASAITAALNNAANQ